MGTVEPMIPRKASKTGRTPVDRRVMLNGLLLVPATGVPWRDLPEHFGPTRPSTTTSPAGDATACRPDGARVRAGVDVSHLPPLVQNEGGC